MKYQLRDYQQRASDAAVRFLTTKTSHRGGLLILPTGAGKSLVIAEIASRIDEPLIVLQPNKEILEQNYNKLLSYDVFDCSIYSASLRRKDINRITFATIRSVMNHIHDFDAFHKIIIDECHLVNPGEGQYKEFLDAVEGRKVVGLTATPYRLEQQIDPKTIKWPNPQYVSILKFLTRTRPRVFERVLYFAQVRDLLDKGYLSPMRYFDMNKLEMKNVKLNTKGSDYDENSLKAEMERADLYEYTLQIVNRVLHPKDGKPRNGILVFTKFVADAERLTWDLDGICEMVSGDTPMKERTAILERFKSGETKVVANVGVLTTGFDYPALDTIILARPTMSLALYYQMVGRAIRPYPGKVGWVIDLCGSCAKFGEVDDLEVDQLERNKWIITGAKDKKQLTNIIMRK